MPNSQPIVKINNSALTPWSSNINASGYALQNLGSVVMGGSSPVSGRQISVISGTFSGISLQTTGAGTNTWTIDSQGNSSSPNNRLSITNGGSDVLTILTSGNVGIGVSNPGCTLQVSASVGIAGGQVGGRQLTINSSTFAGIVLQTTGGTPQTWYIDNRGNDDTPNYRLAFGLNSGDVLALLNSGGVMMPSLPSSNPGAGTKQLWYDPADSNRVKFAA